MGDGSLVVAELPVFAALHGAPSPPVPHWLVLLVVVPALWLLVTGAVLAVDRLLERFGA
ncbi:hypothetical protein [Halomicrobium urmianum]|uniref:hypothetical protein n=1 Tax=Halomicrobium urmianum TaxID=1586233 RepID=UPI001CD93146|nr:hypothetical protein [Halomicrobium urmianum]